MSSAVGIVGCGLMGRKRAAALGDGPRRRGLRPRAGPGRGARAPRPARRPVPDVDAVLASGPTSWSSATTHDALGRLGLPGLRVAAHVLVEKPAGRTVDEVDRIADAAAASGGCVKVGFNHRFHPGIARAVSEVRAGCTASRCTCAPATGTEAGPATTASGGPIPEVSGGGELLDQGMHLLDLSHWLLGPLPLHSALLRTSFWDMPVEDNAVLTLAEPGR